MLSGWNCTPIWGFSRWRTPITTSLSSSVRAVSTSSSGGFSRSTQSEWYRPRREAGRGAPRTRPRRRGRSSTASRGRPRGRDSPGSRGSHTALGGPRQTPNTGRSSAKASIETPASAGCPVPGRRRRRRGRGADPGQIDRVVAPHRDRAGDPRRLDEVVRERVVVVDDEDPRVRLPRRGASRRRRDPRWPRASTRRPPASTRPHHRSAPFSAASSTAIPPRRRASSTAVTSARAFASVSSYSASGSESWTIPARRAGGTRPPAGPACG